MATYTKNRRVDNEGKLQNLAAELKSRNGMARRHAREELERMGREATPYLVRLLGSRSTNARWEATKALSRIADPEAAPALVQALMDESFEVQWLAGEALIAIGPDAVKPLLDGLVHNYGSVYMRQGAHHVLHDLEKRHLLTPPTLRVLEELRSIEPLEPYSVSARRALKNMPVPETPSPRPRLAI
jgi:hypothetical protein